MTEVIEREKTVAVSEDGKRIGFAGSLPEGELGMAQPPGGTQPPFGHCVSFSAGDKGHWSPPPTVPGTAPPMGAKWRYWVFLVNSCPQPMMCSVTWVNSSNVEYRVPATGSLRLEVAEPTGVIAGVWPAK